MPTISNTPTGSPDTASLAKMFERTSQMGKIGVWECDLATEALTWSDMVYDIFGLERQTTVSRSEALACYEPESRREMEIRRAHAIEDGSDFSVDVKLRTPAGVSRWVRITGAVELEDGKAARIFGTKQDITSEKIAQLELQAAQAKLVHLSHQNALKAMESTLAHELNQPLSAIVAYASALLNTISQKGQYSKNMIDIANEINTCAQRAGNILNYLRRSLEMQNEDDAPFDIANEITSALGIAMSHIPVKPKVTLSLTPGLQGCGGATQFCQVIINLIQNSLDALSDCSPQEISIASNEVDGLAVVTICDNRPDISAQVQDSLLDNPIAHDGEWPKLGLAVSRTIVESLWGKLTIGKYCDGRVGIRVSVPLAASDA